MARQIIHNYSTKDFWDESSDSQGDKINKRITNAKEKAFNAQTRLFPKKREEDLYDPFSDLSIFIAKRIKNEILENSKPKNWSRTIQDIVLKDLIPELKKKFPQYKIGLKTLKKTWDKVSYYLTQLQSKQEILTEKGHVNLNQIIKESITQIQIPSIKYESHPYNLAHSLAIKISECIATMNGEKLHVDTLTKTIWAVQKHFMNKESLPKKGPLEKITPLDRLIIRYQLEISSTNYLISHTELKEAINNKIKDIISLKQITNKSILTASISAILANNLYSKLDIHKKLPPQKVKIISDYIAGQINLQMKKKPRFTESDQFHLINRILFLYKLASKLDKRSARKQLKLAINYVFQLSKGAFTPNSPTLNQDVYIFLHNEITMIKENREVFTVDQLLTKLMKSFDEISLLPGLKDQYFEELEILVWKIIFDLQNPLAKLPHRAKHLLKDEISYIQIDNYGDSFQTIVQKTVHFTKNLQNIDASLAEEKIEIWTLQNDMICYWLYFEESHPLLKFIIQKHKKSDLTKTSLSHEEIVSSLYSEYSQTRPHLIGEKGILRMWIMYKYFWYNQARENKETSFQRFIKFHHRTLTCGSQQHFENMHMLQLESICHSLLPLTPFNETICKKLI